MKTIVVLLLIFVVMFSTACAGQAPNQTLSQAPSQADSFARYAAMFDMQSLISGGSVQPNWLADGNRFWYATNTEDITIIKLVDPGSKTVKPFFQVDRLRSELEKLTDTPLPAEGLPFSTFTLSEDENKANFQFGTVPYDLDLTNYKLTKVVAASEVEQPASDTRAWPAPNSLPSPDGKTVLAVRDHNLWLESDGGKSSQQLTEDGSEEMLWSTYGAQWSPDGKQLLVLRYDITDLNTVPIVDWLAPGTPLVRQPSPLSNGKAPIGDVFLLQNGKLIEVPMHLEVDDDPTTIGWNPVTNTFMVMRINRSTNRQDLLSVNPVNGNTKILITEKHDTFLGGLDVLYQSADMYTPVGDNKHFIWMSDRNGFYHLYLYRLDGTLVRQLTKGDYEDLKVLEVDTEGEWIYHLARSGGDDPYQFHVCRVNLKGKKYKRLTDGPGRHRSNFSPDLTCFVDNYSGREHKPTARLISTNGKVLLELETADVSRLVAAGYQIPERAIAKAADGKTDIHAVIYLPPEFDKSLSYPVIEMIYAGPQWTIVPNLFVSREYGETASALSQLGYVTVIIDGRGTPGRGRAFHDYVHERVGLGEIPDHAAALRNLAKKRPWMDMSRVGIHGKSWGGFFAVRAMQQEPDLYKVGVASGVVADLATAGASSIVPFNNLPAENAENYAASNCITNADLLTGKLLMTTGTSDMNTAFSQTMRLLNAFIEAGKDVETLILPGQNHWLQGQHFLRWQRSMRDFFLLHLPPEALPR